MIRFNNEDDGYIIGKCCDRVYSPVTDVVIARVSDVDGKVMGGVILTDYTGVAMSAHMAGLAPNWANRDLIWCVFDYVFNQCGCHSLFGPVPAHNTEALALDRKLGFKEVARIPDAFPDGDLIVLRMKKEECKWLGLKPRAIRSNRVTCEGNMEV